MRWAISSAGEGSTGLRRELGVSALAVSRAGKIHFNPSPDLKMYPGDRIVLLCMPDQAARAVEYLRQRELGGPQEQASAFEADEIRVLSDSVWIHKSLAELDFRNRYGVTVIGIRRGRDKLTAPGASDRLQPDDSIIIVGGPEGVARMRAAGASLSVSE